jgi:hypothetical protein
MRDAANPMHSKVRESRTAKTEDFASSLYFIGQGLYTICGKTLAISYPLSISSTRQLHPAVDYPHPLDIPSTLLP